jgi:hypothetical protein
VRLWVHLARASRRAIVLRRGPSKRVRLVAWDRRTDRFERGQWLVGRVYAHRCDLSPSGKLFVYFAATYKPPFHTWTAVSKPPYFSALALWPKGDAWGGGGLFASERRLELNHDERSMKLAPDFHLVKGFVVEPLGAHSGRGEDYPIAHLRMLRDGWTLIRPGKRTGHSSVRPVSWEYTETQIYAKPSPRRPALRLERHLHGVHEKNGPWYVFSFEVHDEASGQTVDLGRSDWADWDAQGDLLHARDGCIHRTAVENRPLERAATKAELLADLSDDVFERVPPPARATRWKG